MKRKAHSATCLILLLITFFGDNLWAQNVTKRDLARYDDGGIFDFNWSLGPQVHERMRPKLREFIWEHWHQKRLARVVATFYSIEGDPITHRMFIEPDASGRWRVLSEYESECCALYALEKKKRKRQRERGIVIYDIVERVEELKTGKVTWKVIAEEESRESIRYSLRLRRGVDESHPSETFLIL